MKGFVDQISYQELKGFDAIAALSPLRVAGWYISQESGKFTTKYKQGFDIDSPWIYTHPDIDKNCTVDRAMNETCRFIPSNCMACWKVVVKMNRVVDLFALLDWQLEYIKGHPKDRFCKCGMELRPHVTYRYGGYFYNHSKTEGLKRLKDVREAVKKINPDIEVILKRYCTEFEIDLGPSKSYKQHPESKKMEKLCYAATEKQTVNNKQPLFLKKHIMKRWIEHAHTMGDMSYLKFTNGVKLYPDLDTYEGE